MGYRSRCTAEPTKELAALKYALPKEIRLVLKNTISWRGTDNKDNPAYKTEILLCGNKRMQYEGVEFNCELFHKMAAGRHFE